MTDDYRERAEWFLRDHRLCEGTDPECLAALLREVAEEQRREDVCMYTAAVTEVESVRGTCDQLRADLAAERERVERLRQFCAVAPSTYKNEALRRGWLHPSDLEADRG